MGVCEDVVCRKEVFSSLVTSVTSGRFAYHFCRYLLSGEKSLKNVYERLCSLVYRCSWISGPKCSDPTDLPRILGPNLFGLPE